MYAKLGLTVAPPRKEPPVVLDRKMHIRIRSKAILSLLRRACQAGGVCFALTRIKLPMVAEPKGTTLVMPLNAEITLHLQLLRVLNYDRCQGTASGTPICN